MAVVESVSVAPSLSVTLSDTVFNPLVEYVCVGFAAVDVVPSPNVHRYDTIDPSGSFEPALENDTPIPTVPKYGPFASATGP